MSLELLNEHLLVHIISFLEIRDILNMEQSNKNLKTFIKQYQNIIWGNFNKISKFPRIVIYDDNYNYQFKNYTFSLHCPLINIRDKFKIAYQSHQNYLENKLSTL
tara:strand:- start:278 stop:592 length:315 start_codon:yes stop_codon:yes gene_type:complete